MAQYHSLSKELQERILEDRRNIRKIRMHFRMKNRETTHGSR